VVVGVDVAREERAEKIPDRGHQGLKAAEPGAHDADVFHGDALHGQALAHRDGEGVHGQAHGQKKQFPDTHIADTPI